MTKIQCGNFFIDFNQLKEGMQVDERNEFLKKYDTDGNSIFSIQEIEQIKQDIEAAAGDDKNLQENEALSFIANKLGISTEEAKSKFTKFGNFVASGLANLNHQREAKGIAQGMWDVIDDNFKMSSLDSEKFNENWNKVNKDNIIYVLEEFQKSSGNKKNESLPISIIWEKTSSSKTQRELISNIYNLLKENIDTSKYDISQVETEFKDLMKDNNLFLLENEGRINALFDTMVQMAKGQTVVSATNSDTTGIIAERNIEATLTSEVKQGKVSEFLDDICGKFGGVTKENVQEILAKYQEIEKELAALENNPVKYAEKFEELFGVKYSPEAVENYKNVNAKYKEALLANQLDAAFDEMFELELRRDSLEGLFKRQGHAAVEHSYNATYEKLCRLFEKEGKGGKETIDLILQEESKNITNWTPNGCLKKYEILHKLIKEISEGNKENLKHILGDKTLSMLKDERDGAFRAGYGMQNDALLEAEHWVESQQKRLGYTQMGVQILAMAGAMFTGGGTLALLSTATILADPIGLTEQMTDPDGMTAEDWENFMTGRAETLGWMALGMVSGGVGMAAGNFVKLKGLSSIMAKSGKTLSELVKNPNLPATFAKQIKNVENLASLLGKSTEVALDITTTALLQKEGATTGDWIASIAGAIAGGSSPQCKQLLAETDPSKALATLKNLFPDFNISKDDCSKILAKIRELNQKANDWANTPTKSTSMVYSTVIPPLPMLEKAAKFVTKIVSSGIENLFKADGAHTVTKLKTTNPIAYDAVTDIFTKITTQLCAGKIPSREMLDEVIEKTAKKYAAGIDEHGIDANLLREYFDAYTDYDGWNVIKKYFNTSEATNAKKMDEIKDAMSYFKDTCDINMPEEAVTKVEAESPVAKTEPVTKVDESANIDINDTMDPAQLFDKEHLYALGKLDEKTYNMVTKVFDTICKEIINGTPPSSEMYARIIDDAAQKFNIDRNVLEKKINDLINKKNSSWATLYKYLQRPENRNVRNGKVSNEVKDVVAYFKKKRGIVETKPTQTTVKAETPAPTTKAENVAPAKVEEPVRTKAPEETFEITDELAEKYKYELDQPFYDRKSEANLIKIMENYHNLIEGKEFDYKNIDLELEFILTQNGINYNDVNIAMKLIKERFHKDILADIQRVKDLGNKYNLAEETIRQTDDLINEIKSRMVKGEPISKDNIEEMIQDIDYRSAVAERIENLIYDNPDIKNYLNDCTHRDVWNNPDIREKYDSHVIEEATKTLDKILRIVDDGIELTDALIKDMLTNTYMGTDELLYKLIEEHHKLGPMYKNLEGNPAKK